jgi:hypothetical protein
MASFFFLGFSHFSHFLFYYYYYLCFAFFQYFTLPHPFRSDSGRTFWGFWSEIVINWISESLIGICRSPIGFLQEWRVIGKMWYFLLHSYEIPMLWHSCDILWHSCFTLVTPLWHTFMTALLHLLAPHLCDASVTPLCDLIFVTLLWPHLMISQ